MTTAPQPALEAAVKRYQALKGRTGMGQMDAAIVANIIATYEAAKPAPDAEGLIKRLRCEHEWVNYHDAERWKSGGGYYRSTCDKCGTHSIDHLTTEAADALTAAQERVAGLEKLVVRYVDTSDVRPEDEPLALDVVARYFAEPAALPQAAKPAPTAPMTKED